MLKIYNLTKSFGKNTILENINWSIEPGQIIGLIGKNGAGKSTLLRCIAGIYEYELGKITLNDIDVKDNPNTKRNIILLSDVPFEMKQQSLSQLKEFYQVFYPEFDSSIYRDLLMLFNFDENKPLNRASKGIKRQSSLIIALSLRPELLLLDESYDGLDPYVRKDLTKYLREKFIDQHHSIIISSHNVYELEHLCDDLVLLENSGIHQELNNQETNLNKIQVGFNYDVDNNQLSSLVFDKVEKLGRVFIFHTTQSFDEFKASLSQLHPALVYELPKSTKEQLLNRIGGSF